MAQPDIQHASYYFGVDSEGDSEDTQCVLDNIEERLSALERVLWAMCQQRQSAQTMRKKKTTFDYIEFWLSTTVHQSNCMPSREDTVQMAADRVKKDAMAD
jgi:hypothetical protein